MLSKNARTAMLVLAYIPFLGFIPLILKETDGEVRWHARNGLLLYAAVVATGVTATLICIAVPALSCLYGIAMFSVAVVYTIIAILAVVKALQGQRLMVPGISRHAARR
jgi:uncharacterized membrane protein